MGELKEHLERRPMRLPFKPRELNEILLLAYNLLDWTIRDRCDILRITPHDATWIREGLPVGQLPQFSRQTMSFRAAMEWILERDEIVRKHLVRVAETPDEVIYRLTDDDESLPGLVGAASRAPANG
jgi:hypothetical protein